MFYTITLNPSIDYLFFCKELKFNQTNRTNKKKSLVNNYFFGGKGVNVALCFYQHNENVRMLFTDSLNSNVLIDHLLKPYQLKASQIVRFNVLENMRLNAKIMINQQMTEINDHNYLKNEEVLDSISNYFEKNLKTNDIVSLNGSFPIFLNPELTNEQIEINFVKKLIQIIQNKKAFLVLDTTKQTTEIALQFQPLLIKPNLEELFYFFNQPISTSENALKLIYDNWINKCHFVLLSLGAKGAILCTKNISIKLSLLKNLDSQKIVSLQGCGDCMVGAFVAYLQKNNWINKKLTETNLINLLKYATAAGIAKAFSNTIPNAQLIEKYFQMYTNDLTQFNLEIQEH